MAANANAAASANTMELAQTGKRDELRELELKYQAKWQADRLFDVDPPSPKWRTRPLRALCETPMALQPETSMFSSRTETVCDFPDPWTPHTMAENGAFYRHVRADR